MGQPDHYLLEQFNATRSEAAFSEIVARHVNMVYSAARRAVKDAHLAEDVTQAVFLLLAQKSKSLGPGVVLAGWLFQTTRYASASAIRMRQRQARREREAAMNNPSETEPPDTNWEEIAPQLNDAVAKLSRLDRDAIVLRFFEGRSHAEVGSALGVSEEAARVRVSRALGKLRGILGKRGMQMSAIALASDIGAKSILIAPAGAVAASVAVTSGAAALQPSILAQGVHHMWTMTN